MSDQSHTVQTGSRARRGRETAQEAHEEALLERAVGEAAPPLPSLLRPQQNRDIVWRWHVRRRQGR